MKKYNVYKLEYSPYTTPLTKVFKFVNFVIKKELEESLVEILLESNQRLTKELPEDLRELIYDAKIREIMEGKDKSLEYLAKKLKENKTLFVKLLRLFKINEFSCAKEDEVNEFLCIEEDKEVIELSGEKHLKICIKYYDDPLFLFQTENPIVTIKTNRKSKSVLLETLGSCSYDYDADSRAEGKYKRSVTVDKSITIPEDFPGILITFRYSVFEKWCAWRTCSLETYGVLYSFVTGKAVSFKFKKTAFKTANEVTETVKNTSVEILLKLIPYREKKRVEKWIKENTENSKEKTEKKEKNVNVQMTKSKTSKSAGVIYVTEFNGSKKTETIIAC